MITIIYLHIYIYIYAHTKLGKYIFRRFSVNKMKTVQTSFEIMSNEYEICQNNVDYHTAKESVYQ